MASNLAEFAAGEAEAEAKRTKCFTCNLPEELLAQVEEARLQTPPITYPIISRWLEQEDETISEFNLRNHFQARHHILRSAR